MFKRDISTQMVETILETGEIIKSYPEDKPYPSFLILGFTNEKPIHLVVAKNSKTLDCVIVTAYIPDLGLWEEDFKEKK
ncbi:protein of unknown function [Algoriphagus hitonicola]|uniref:DUF4258 domain-containing protein n=2 Tax=Algoriphagus hitonicola TaxID=435880 RepID=A0A1I2XTH5_9BACT|nr:protein of unknown function [Algoriphagus hitonicola]